MPPGSLSLATGLVGLTVGFAGIRLAGQGVLTLSATTAAGGSIRAVEATVVPRHFGTAHLGAIRGVVTGVGVAGTAFGPVVLALGRQVAGSYVPVLLALVPLGVGMASMFARIPAPAAR